MLRRNGPVVKSVESVLRLEGSTVSSKKFRAYIPTHSTLTMKRLSLRASHLIYALCKLSLWIKRNCVYESKL